MITPSHLGSEKTLHAMPAHLLHNLRTELSPIIGCAELLMEQAHEQGQDAFVADLQIIHAAGRRLEAFINDNFHGVHMPETPAAIAAQQAVPIGQEPASEAFPAEPLQVRPSTHPDTA